jgi:hypothetical protein
MRTFPFLLGPSVCGFRHGHRPYIVVLIITIILMLGRRYTLQYAIVLVILSVASAFSEDRGILL